MDYLSQLETRVLDAMADDWEELEQIYISLSYELIDSEGASTLRPSYTFRRRQNALRLTDIANALRALLDKGKIVGRTENGDYVRDARDLSMIWRSWFRPINLISADPLNR